MKIEAYQGWSDQRPRRRIAVIGGGISGLGAAWLLARKHQVTLFESEPTAGGHARTLDIDLDGLRAPVDVGFLVFNRRTYPDLCGLFATLGVKTAASEMSFSVADHDSGIEWAGTSLDTVFAQRRNLLRPGFLAMIREMLRFNREASALASADIDDGETLGEFLDRRRFGATLRNLYLLPMAAAIWSCPTRRMLAFPMSTFARFCENHGLLQIQDRPQWLTVAGGSREYVGRMLTQIPDVRLASPVQRIERSPERVKIMTRGSTEYFDDVVFACHSDQALRLLGAEARAEERAILGAVRYQSNRVVVHHDAWLLPKRRKVWSAWNYAAGTLDQPGGDRPVCVSYLINRLQPLPFSSPVVVTLNPWTEPDPGKRLAKFEFDHPIFDQAAIRAQGHLATIQGRRRTWYCGAWTGYGFHEDGLRSAIRVALRFGVAPPWASANPQPVEQPEVSPWAANSPA